MEPQNATRAMGIARLRPWWPAFAMFTAACALRLGLLFSTSLVPQTDGAYYLAQVRSILAGEGLRFADTPLLFWIQALMARLLELTTSLDLASATIAGVKLVDALVPPEYKDLLFRSARPTLPLSGESTIPITKKDNPGRGSSQEQEIYHERGRRACLVSRTATNAPKKQ